MNAIALTGRDRDAMDTVAQLLTTRITAKDLKTSLYLDVRSLAEAEAIYCAGGELWRVGHDLTRPEIDGHIDRQIDTAVDEQKLVDQVDHCLGLFLARPAGAAP